MPVATECQAKKFIDSIRSKHSDASHNCYAYGVSGNITRFSDDGEVQGTAGMPILNVFLKGGIVDFVCVVVRYYGGIQLGAGGLVRAYSKAAKSALESAGVIEQIKTTQYTIVCNYSNVDKVKYFFKQLGVEILEAAFENECKMIVKVKNNVIEQFFKNDLIEVEE